MNALEIFKNQYAGRDTLADELTADAIKKMTQAYENTFNSIFTKMQQAKQDVSYSEYAKQSRLLKQIAKELDKLKRTSGKYLREALTQAAEYETKVTYEALDVFNMGITRPEEWHLEFNKKYAEQTFKDQYFHIAGQTDRMQAQMKTQLQADARQIFQRAAVDGITRKKAYYELKEKILSSTPDFQFTDKSGKNWKTETYLNMLTRTAMHNTSRESNINVLTNEGHDLVKVIINGAKDDCRNWEGRILSLTGATKGYPTVAEAKGSGEIFHPRCRHRVIAYHESIDDVFKAVESGMDDEQILAA